jgi:Disulphide bond corrector protein DsbC
MSHWQVEKNCWKLAVTVCWLASMVAAEQFSKLPQGLVSVAPTPTTGVIRGRVSRVELHFRVASGFHINSHTPNSKVLIPTTLKLDPPTDIAMGQVRYPKGTDISVPFAKGEKLNVYSGDFEIVAAVRPLRTVVPGEYQIRGALRYQACDNRACYPPKQVPLQFLVRVNKKTSVGVRKNRQSPHVHH